MPPFNNLVVCECETTPHYTPFVFTVRILVEAKSGHVRPDEFYARYSGGMLLKCAYFAMCCVCVCVCVCVTVRPVIVPTPPGTVIRLLCLNRSDK